MRKGIKIGLWFLCICMGYCQNIFHNVEKNIKDAIKKLGSEEPALIDEGREALLFYGSLATDELINALESEKIEVRFLACQLLGEIRDRKAIPYLLLLFDKKVKVLSSISSCAAESLGLLQAKEAIPKLIESLDSDDAELKYNALKSLGYLHATEAIDKIKKLLSDNSATYFDGLIRAQAIRTLELLGPESAIKELKKLLTDTAIEKFTGKQVRYYAVRALQGITDLDFGNIDAEDEPARLEEIYNKWVEWAKKTDKKEESGEKKEEDPLKKLKELLPPDGKNMPENKNNEGK
ncbi:MAG: HEAT repeat domain-containing protein [Planctomycetota bacterium]